jgi:hypothetical protein
VRSLLSIGILLCAAAPGHARPHAHAELRGAKVDCQLQRSWGRDAAGKPWLQYDMSCSVPKKLGAPLRRQDPAKVLRGITDPDVKFTAATVIAAQGRFHLLSAPERARYVLELARRHNEPFASTQVGFVFGRKPWWERRARQGTSPSIYRLGTMAAPWERSMTPVIRAYLFPGIKQRPVSTLAVYLCTQMADRLDRAIKPDLRRVKRLSPGSFEARMADKALGRLARRSAR